MTQIALALRRIRPPLKSARTSANACLQSRGFTFLACLPNLLSITPHISDFLSHLAKPRRVLTNGYSMAQTALALHRIQPPLESALTSANTRLQSRGFALYEDGDGVVRASEDGLVLQSATVADLVEVYFAGESKVTDL